MENEVTLNDDSEIFLSPDLETFYVLGACTKVVEIFSWIKFCNYYQEQSFCKGNNVFTFHGEYKVISLRDINPSPFLVNCFKNLETSPVLILWTPDAPFKNLIDPPST